MQSDDPMLCAVRLEKGPEGKDHSSGIPAGAENGIDSGIGGFSDTFCPGLAELSAAWDNGKGKNFTGTRLEA